GGHHGLRSGQPLGGGVVVAEAEVGPGAEALGGVGVDAIAGALGQLQGGGEEGPGAGGIPGDDEGHGEHDEGDRFAGRALLRAGATAPIRSWRATPSAARPRRAAEWAATPAFTTHSAQLSLRSSGPRDAWASASARGK